MVQTKNKFDVAVIGGGPAGMMAAIWAARSGAETILIERNETLGKKLLLTGGGRCNFANAENDLRRLVVGYGKTGPFLFHAFSEFGPQAVVDFFNDLGIKTVVEDNGRVFPKSGLANEVLAALLRTLKESGVEIRFNSTVTGVKKENGSINQIILSGGEIVKAKNHIIATGGKSHPATGSTGEGYNWAHDLGHCIEKLKPALVPLKTKETWAKNLSGVSLKNAGIAVFQNGKKVFRDNGEILFAHFGLSGPAILGISGRVGELLEKGEVTISLNPLPESNLDALEKDLHAKFSKNPNRQLANCLTDVIPQSIAAAVCGIADIDAEKTVNDITRAQRRLLAVTILDLRLSVTGLMDIESGMVTGGGVALESIDDKTMRSKVILNLFFGGEIIDVHGRTGGYNLLQCWSTGRLAGISAAKTVK